MVTANWELDFFARFDLYNSEGSSAAATGKEITNIRKIRTESDITNLEWMQRNID